MAFGTTGTDAQSYYEALEARRPQLQAAFERVQNSDHWKGPINWTGILTSSEAVLTLEAIEFYTATPGHIRYLSTPSGSEGRAHVQITAKGYWAGPAN